VRGALGRSPPVPTLSFSGATTSIFPLQLSGFVDDTHAIAVGSRASFQNIYDLSSAEKTHTMNVFFQKKKEQKKKNQKQTPEKLLARILGYFICAF